MNPKTTNMMCIILAIIIVILLGYAAMNKGKLWGEEKFTSWGGGLTSNTVSSNVTCPAGQEAIMGQCRPKITIGNFDFSSFPPLP